MKLRLIKGVPEAMHSVKVWPADAEDYPFWRHITGGKNEIPEYYFKEVVQPVMAAHGLVAVFVEE